MNKQNKTYYCTFYLNTFFTRDEVISLLKEFMGPKVKEEKFCRVINYSLEIGVEYNIDWDWGPVMVPLPEDWRSSPYCLSISPSNQDKEDFDVDLYIRELRKLCEFLEDNYIVVAMHNHFGNFDMESDERDENWEERVRLFRKKAKEDVSCCFFFDTILSKDKLIDIISRKFPLNQPYNIIGDTTLNITLHDNENYNEKLIKYEGGWLYSRYCLNIKPIDKDYKIHDRKTCINEIVRLAEYLEAHNIPTVITGMFGDEINADYRFDTWKERREKLIKRAQNL